MEYTYFTVVMPSEDTVIDIEAVSVAIPCIPLFEAAELPQEQLDEVLTELPQQEIHDSWGEPDGRLSGFWGEIYHLSDRYESIILYYDADGLVESIKIECRNETK